MRFYDGSRPVAVRRAVFCGGIAPSAVGGLASYQAFQANSLLTWLLILLLILLLIVLEANRPKVCSKRQAEGAGVAARSFRFILDKS